jgi:hypothetical protein
MENQNRTYIIIFILCLSGIFQALQLSAQKQNEEVTIIAPYKPSISDAYKMNFSPEIPVTSQGQEQEFNYSHFLDTPVNTSITLKPIEPVRTGHESQDKLFRNLIKAGFGNYTTPYLEYFANSLRSEKYQFGVHLKHLSSQGGIKDYAPSNFSQNLFEAGGKAFTGQHTFSGKIGYKRDVVHFYGFQPDAFPNLDVNKDDIKQRLQLIKAGLRFGSNYAKATKFNHAFYFNFYNLSDFYDSHENMMNFGMELDKGLRLVKNDMEQALGLDLDFKYYNFKDSLNTFQPYYVNALPYFKFGFEQYAFYVGASINVDKDTISHIHIFPVARAEVRIVEDVLKVFAEIKGAVNQNTFKSLTDANPFIISSPVMKPTINKFEFSGGLAGNVSGIDFRVEVSDAALQDRPFFVTDNSDPLGNKFDIIYDDLNLLTVSASLGLSRANQYSFKLKGNYYVFTMDNELKPWQEPTMTLDFDASYTIVQKFIVTASVNAFGTRYAKTVVNNTVVPVQMDGGLDLNAGLEYRYSKTLSAFIRFQNILNNKYQRWYNYPVQGLQAMIGVSYSF